jgi:signal transduction histidine kinase
VNASEALSLVVAVLDLGLALALLPQLGRFGRAFPWLGLLMVYFGLRGAERLYFAVTNHESETASLVSDGVLVVVLVLLAAGLRRTVRGLRLAVDEAKLRAQEYERALRDYQQLVRHRLANPLMQVRGSALTLRARRRELAPEEQEQLLEVLDEAAERLEQISLDPGELAAEEHGLEPTPRVP